MHVHCTCTVQVHVSVHELTFTLTLPAIHCDTHHYKHPLFTAVANIKRLTVPVLTLLGIAVQQQTALLEATVLTQLAQVDEERLLAVTLEDTLVAETAVGA